MTPIGPDRLRLTQLEQERIDLGYLHPHEPAFAENLFTRRLAPEPEADTAAPPRVTFYSQPVTEFGPLDLGAAREWLDPARHLYGPLTHSRFVPGERRMFADGVIAYADSRGDGTLSRFLAVRRTGTIEYAPYCAWSHPHSGKIFWLINVKLLLGQWEQFLRFLIRFGTDFERASPWVAYVNVRNAAGAVLVDFGKGWASAFDYERETTTCDDENVQFEMPVAGTEHEIADRVREFAHRLEYAYGFHQARIYNRTAPIGLIEYDVRYS